MCGLKFLEETDIVLGEHAQILDLIFQIGDSFDTHTQGEARIFLGIDAASVEHIRIHHAATEDFNPSGPFTERASFTTAKVARDIHLGRWLCKREIARAEAYLSLLTKHLAGEIEQGLLQISE